MVDSDQFIYFVNQDGPLETVQQDGDEVARVLLRYNGAKQQVGHGVGVQVADVVGRPAANQAALLYAREISGAFSLKVLKLSFRQVDGSLIGVLVS